MYELTSLLFCTLLEQAKALKTYFMMRFSVFE